jgi:mannosyltransferase
MQQMDAVITTSSAAARYLHHRPPDVIVPHGVDTNRFRPAASRQEAWRQTGLPGEFGIAAFGRVRHSKGIDVLIDAALPLLDKYPGATVVIVGQCLPRDLPFQQKLRQRIALAGHQQRVRFLGEQPFDTLPGLFASMSVIAALSREEGFGLTPLEAMASGAAVLTSEAGAWPDVVRDGTDGYRVATGDIEATRQKLDALLGDPARTEQMGAAGRQRVLENYSIEREAQQLTDFLLSLASNNMTNNNMTNNNATSKLP